MILQYITQKLCVFRKRNKLKDMIVFLLREYPKDLDVYGLTDLCYLADWHYTINHKQQISNAKYEILENVTMVYCDQVRETMYNNHNLFYQWNPNSLAEHIKNSYTFSEDFCIHKWFLRKHKKALKYTPKLTDEEKKSLTHVVNLKKNLSNHDFHRIKFSTYPIISSHNGAKLDLATMAQKYKSLGQK
jgi:hypothetical protein